MRHKSVLHACSLAGVLALFFLSGCLPFRGRVDNPGALPGLQITVRDVYQGVGDGNIESVPLPAGSSYITVEGCIKNLSGTEQSVHWRDVFIVTSDEAQIFPVAVGYDQAEAFSWLLEAGKPLGATHIDHKFYFFLIQSDELMRLGANQSLGCHSPDEQFKSLAFLFIAKDEVRSQPFTLRFFEGGRQLEARQIIAISPAVKWAAGLGILLMGIVPALIIARKKKLKAQASPLQQEEQDSPAGSGG